MKTHSSFFAQLPLELNLYILNGLDLKSRAAFREVCTTHHTLDSNQAYKNLLGICTVDAERAIQAFQNKTLGQRLLDWYAIKKNPEEVDYLEWLETMHADCPKLLHLITEYKNAIPAITNHHQNRPA